MNDSHKPGLTIRILFLTVLLAAQGFVSAHGIDHVTLNDSSSCAVCALGSGLGDSAVEAIGTFQATPGKAVPVLPLNAFVPEQHPVTRPSRGPPTSL